MSELDYSKKYMTRSKGGYAPFPNYGVKFKNSFFPYISNLWNKLEVSTQLLDLAEFKIQLKKELKPPKYKHFSKGSKLGNSLLTRVRLERSHLNAHKFNIGQSDSPECQILFNLVEFYIPSFKTMNRNAKYKVLVMGFDPQNTEITQTNVTISIAVQRFIFETKRFPQ